MFTPLHDGAVLLRHHLEDFALLALVPAGDDDDVVALLDLELRHHSTSGASETIFMWFLALSSRGDRPEDAGADRLALRVDQHRGVAVEADQRAVGPAHALGGAHHDGLHHLALLHAAARDRLLDRDDDDVADRGVFALRAAQHLDALNAPRAGIVGDVEIGLHLDHGLSPASTCDLPLTHGRLLRRGFNTTHRLFFEIGGLSSIHTMSPTLNVVLLVVGVIFLACGARSFSTADACSAARPGPPRSCRSCRTPRRPAERASACSSTPSAPWRRWPLLALRSS